MEQKDKELLLKDICARLPYGVKLWHESFKDVVILHAIDATQFAVDISIDDSNNNTSFWNSIEQVKPYLFPLSSMTEEQNKILIKNYNFSFNSCSDAITNGIYSPIFNRTIYYSVNEDDISKIIDWLNKNHFDYRGLIEKELAIDTTGLNIY